jgi:hypothetical protein
VPGTAMADAFSQAGYYDNAYAGNAEDAEEQPVETAQAQAGEDSGDEQAEAAAEGEGDERLEDIVEDLKRKNATE